MRHLLLTILPLSTLLFFGCSSKNITVMDTIKERKHNANIRKINVSTSNIKDTVFINSNDQVTYLCMNDKLSSSNSTCKRPKKDAESIIGITDNGYKPFYSTYTRTCGFGSYSGVWAVFVDDFGIRDYTKDAGCVYRFNELSSFTTDESVDSFILSLGTSMITSLTLHENSFAPYKLRKAINQSKLDTYLDKLKALSMQYNVEKGGFEFIYIDPDNIKDSLIDKLQELQSSKSIRAGYIVLNEDNNEMLSIIILNKYKHLSAFEATIRQVKDIQTDIKLSHQYTLSSNDVKRYIPREIRPITPPSDETLVKDEFETDQEYNKRVKESKDITLSNYKELYNKYISKRIQRKETIDKLNTNFTQYQKDIVKTKQTLLNNIHTNINSLYKLVYELNSPGYRAKEFEFDAQESKLYFTLYSKNNTHSAKAVVTMPPYIAKDIKKYKDFYIFAQTSVSKDESSRHDTLNIDSYKLVDIKSSKVFPISYTNKQYKNKAKYTIIKTKAYKIAKLQEVKFKDTYNPDDTKIIKNYTVTSKSLIAADDEAYNNWSNKFINNKKSVIGSGNTPSEALNDAITALSHRINTKVNSSIYFKSNISDLSINNTFNNYSTQTSSVNLGMDDYKILESKRIDGRYFVAIEYLI